MDKLNWKASLGMELDEGDISEYISAVDAMIESSKQYLEDKHYEATAAIDLLVEPGNEIDMTTGLNQMYSDLQSKIETLGGDLKAKVNVALEDGVITLDEQAEITNLQNQIADITNQISQAETEASFQSLKIKYSGASLDADSFASLVSEIQANVEEAASQYDEALQVSLTNLNLQLQNGSEFLRNSSMNNCRRSPKGIRQRSRICLSELKALNCSRLQMHSVANWMGYFRILKDPLRSDSELRCIMRCQTVWMWKTGIWPRQQSGLIWMDFRQRRRQPSPK